MKDNINPSHYKQGKIEVIEFILDQKMSYLEGNVIKYISRYKFKNGLEDLNKAKWYTNKLIEEYKNEDD
jgi:adenine-specific DNA glycosylase